MLATGHCNTHVSWSQLFHTVAVKVALWLSPSLLFHYCLFHAAAAVESADRSPRPTSAPAIAPSQAAEGGVPGAPVKKAQKETVQVEVKKEETPPEDAEPEPTEAWKVCRKPRGPAHSLSDSEVLTPWPGGFSKHWFLLNTNKVISSSLFPKEGNSL